MSRLPRMVLNIIMSGLPLFIVAGLLYAGLFIKPQPKGTAVSVPIFARGDGLYGLSALESGKVWVVGSNGKIAVSENGGDSWQKQVSAFDDALQDVAAWDEQRVVAVGNGGVVVLTSDGGRSWRAIEVPRSKIANKLLRVKALPGGGAWAVGEAGSVLHSTDYGNSWRQEGADEDIAWNDISFTAGHAWLVGEFGRIKLSNDDGASWRSVTGPVNTSLMSVSFRNASDGVAVGLGGVVLSSRDGGQSWVQEKSPSSEHLFSVIWDGNRWIAIGAKGAIVVIEPDGRAMKLTRLSDLDRNWYTAIAKQGTRYLLVGSRVVATAANTLSEETK